MYPRGFAARALASTVLVQAATPMFALLVAEGCNASSDGIDATTACSSCAGVSASGGSSSGGGVGASSSGGTAGDAETNGASSGGGSSGSSSGGSGGRGGDEAGGGSSGSSSGGGTQSWDLSGWQLQLPIGTTDDPRIVDNPTGFSDVYFFVDADDSLTFMDPPTGVSTPGSVHPRSELRELTSWLATGENVMTATVAVTKVPSTVYFKWGDYDQTATVGPISTVQGTVVKFYKHAVTHQ